MRGGEAKRQRSRSTAVVACALSALGVFAAATAVSARGATQSSARATHTPVYTFGVVGTRPGKIAALEHTRPAPIPGIKGSIVQITTSNSDTYALTSTGAVWAWGVGSSGQLGNGTNPMYVSRASRVQFPRGVRIASLPEPTPYDAGLAIDTQGRAWVWGFNVDGDLCLPSAGLELRPVRLALQRVSLATGAGTHSVFDADGRVVACGQSDDGQLGDGSSASASSPVAVDGLRKGRIAALTSSYKGSGALMANGAYYDWGLNDNGQLGDGSTSNSGVAVHVRLPGRVTQVSQGGSNALNGQTVVLLDNGTVWAWGSGTRGQLGDGAAANALTPVPVKVPAGVHFASVDSGGYTSYAIDRSGALWAWGLNQMGQLGTGSARKRALAPVRVGLRLTQVSSTASNVAGLRSAGAAKTGFLKDK